MTSTPYQPPFVLGVHGTKGQGKDTLARHLMNLDERYTRFAFADRLKDDLRPFVMDHFNFDSADCTPAEKEIIRPILIAYGCAQRAVNPTHWVEVVIDDIRQLPPVDFAGCSYIPIVTDVRFPNEAECLAKAFGSAFRLLDVVRFGGPPPTDEEEKHYRKVAATADYRFTWGNDTEEQQIAKAREVDAWIKSRLPAEAL